MLQLMLDMLSGASEPPRIRVEFVLTPLGWQWINAETKEPLLHKNAPIFDRLPESAGPPPERDACKSAPDG